MKRSHTPPSSRPLDRRANRPAGTTGGGRPAGKRKARRRSCHPLGWPLPTLEPGEVGVVELLAGLSCLFCGHAAGDERRYGRANVPALASAAGERSGDVVQRADQPHLLLAGQPIDGRPGEDIRIEVASPRGNPWGGVCGQLIPSRAERLKGVLQRRERIGRRCITLWRVGGCLEVPGRLDQSYARS